MKILNILIFCISFFGIFFSAHAEVTYQSDDGSLTITETRTVISNTQNTSGASNTNTTTNTSTGNSSTSNTQNNTGRVGTDQAPLTSDLDIQISENRGAKGNSLVSLDDLKGDGKDINIADYNGDGSGFRELILQIAESIKRIFYVLAGLFFLIISIKLIVASNTEDELQKFKRGILWITIGVIIMNLAVYFVNLIYNPYATDAAKSVSFDLGNLAQNLLENIAYPTVKLLETATAFFFLLIAIIAFFRIITANGNEEEAKRGRMSIFYAVIGFVLVVIAAELVFAVYGGCDGNYSQVANIFNTKCNQTANLSGAVGILVEIIRWLNGFVAVVVILMIIYAGANIMFSGGEEEKISKAKKSILYIIIGIAILIANYLLLTFFIN